MSGVISLDVAHTFRPYVQAAIARLGYLYPKVDWSFNSENGCIEARFPATSHDAETLKKEALFQLYREKIYHDTLPIRSRLYDTGTP